MAKKKEKKKGRKPKENNNETKEKDRKNQEYKWMKKKQINKKTEDKEIQKGKHEFVHKNRNMSVKSEGKEQEQVELIQDSTEQRIILLRSDVPGEFRSAAIWRRVSV